MNETYSDDEGIDYESLTEFQKKVHYLENNLDLGVSWSIDVQEWWGENQYIFYYECAFNGNYVRKEIYSNGKIEYDIRASVHWTEEHGRQWPAFREYYSSIDGLCNLCLDPTNYDPTGDYPLSSTPFYKQSEFDYMNQQQVFGPTRGELIDKYTKNYETNRYYNLKDSYLLDFEHSYKNFAVLVNNGLSLPIINEKMLERRESVLSDLDKWYIIHICHVLHLHGIQMPSSIKWMDKKYDVMQEIYTKCICGEGNQKKAVWETWTDKGKCWNARPILTDIECTEEYVKNLIINKQQGPGQHFSGSEPIDWYLKKEIRKFRVECKCLCSCDHRRI